MAIKVKMDSSVRRITTDKCYVIFRAEFEQILHFLLVGNIRRKRKGRYVVFIEVLDNSFDIIVFRAENDKIFFRRLVDQLDDGLHLLLDRKVIGVDHSVLDFIRNLQIVLVLHDVYSIEKSLYILFCFDSFDLGIERSRREDQLFS